MSMIANDVCIRVCIHMRIHVCIHMCLCVIVCVFMYVLRCANFILVCKCIIGNSKSVIERESLFVVQRKEGAIARSSLR